jgi:hypothetical protein
MKWMQEQSKYENVAYVALWGLLFTAPLLTLYLRTTSDSNLTFNWQEVWMVWRHFWVYLLIFLVHNFVLAPLLVYRQKRWLYVVLTACMIGAFTFYQCSHQPERKFRGEKMEMTGDKMEMPGERQGHEPPPPLDEHDGEFAGPQDKQQDRPQDRPHPEFRKHRPDAPHAIRSERDIVAIVIVILMCGMNLGVKLYFKSRNDQKKLRQLEKENLQQQLEYLKYQINPHFFMNTLNNIHALVDIDPEKAKDTILELSKMMRFVLYEGDKEGVPLSREFEFIRHYIQLMKLRYTDKVKIAVDLPAEAPDKLIPPLMLITFIENAFKHGISYQHKSFIDIKVEISHPSPLTTHLLFSCRNSKAEKPNEEKGGVGLQNVKQRLNLLYDNNYTLNIKDESDVYSVDLTIPL